MGDQNRPRSPVSENTILNFARESGLNINFDDSEGNESDSSDIQSSDDLVDDTDEDPTFDPDTPGPSAGRRPRLFPDIQRNPPDLGLSSDSEEDEPRPTQPTGGRGIRGGMVRRRPMGNRRGVGIGRPNAAPQQNAGDSSSWDEVEEENDEGYPHQFQYSEINGPKHCPPQNSRPIDYLNLFFTHTLLETFATETNRYARKFIAGQQQGLTPFSRARKWVNMTIIEVKAFIAIILNMGLIRKPSIESYWDTHYSQMVPYFGKMMSRDRFQLILKSMKHAKKVIFNVMGRMVLNSYLLYKLNTTQGKMNRANFMRSVIEDWSNEWLASKQDQGPVDVEGGGDGPQVGFGLRKLPGKKEKLCKACSGENHPEGKKRRSRTICVRCGAGVHGECFVNHVCE